MLEAYLKAENLKMKHSLFGRLILLVPAVLVLSSIVLIYVGVGLGAFSGVIVCNWCMPMASLTVVVLCHLVNGKDQKHQNRTLYSLPINLKKLFISKSILTALCFLSITLVMALITVTAECISSGIPATIGMTGYYILGYLLLWSTILWQIPFCLFLEQKIGFAGSVIINLFASALGGIFLYLTPLFWIFPHSWPARIMAAFFGVMTNGLLVPEGSRLILSLGESVLLIFTALFFTFALSALFSHWYRKQVYRK